MKIRDLYVGDALQWQSGKAYKRGSNIRYGVVLSISEDKKRAMIANVFISDGKLKCYDEQGASYEQDRNNVRLKHAPPPFHTICRFDQVDKPIGTHDPQHPTIIDDNFLEVNKVGFEDVWYRRLNKQDIAELLNHPWPEQKELEATRKTLQPIQSTHAVQSAGYSIPQMPSVKTKKLPPVGPKTVQAEAAPAAPKTPSKTLKQGFSDVDTAVEAQASRSQPKQAKPKSWSSDRPLGRLADLAENLSMTEEDGPDFEL